MEMILDRKQEKLRRIPITRADASDEVRRAESRNAIGLTEAEERAPAREQREPDRVGGGKEVNWRDRALRMQAEMENFRRRQVRRADERIGEEKNRLLRAFLEIMDDLEAALAQGRRDEPLYQGVRVTYDEMLKLLLREGVESIPAQGEPFDPEVHEAMAMVPAVPGQKEDLLVVQVEERGYRRGSRLLRPARVIVAKKA